MYVIQKEIDCIRKALEEVKKTDSYERRMQVAVKEIVNAKYIIDTTLIWVKKPGERQYKVLHTAEELEAIIALVSAFKEISRKNKLQSDETLDVLTSLVKRVYNELIKFVVVAQ